ncbi:MAG: hypothetical protein QOI59_5239, partial [Gammaproteobacteria bacterium]|nr:hypothetical protein [Gammaproteobacteria bacterium]
AIWQKLRWTKANGYVAYTTKIGARSRTRTGMALRPRDFKSLASTDFATRAYFCGAAILSQIRQKARR